MDDKGQMMVMESVIFAITIILALIFLYQLSPSSTLTYEYTKDLKIQGDDALRTLYNTPILDKPANYPSNKLVYYLITNDYSNFTLNINYTLPDTAQYNIWISNGTKTVFWCNKISDYTTPMAPIRSIITSHLIVAIDPAYLKNDTGIFAGEYKLGKYDYGDNRKSDLNHPSAFQSYSGSTYNIILELWQIV